MKRGTAEGEPSSPGECSAALQGDFCCFAIGDERSGFRSVGKDSTMEKTRGQGIPTLLLIILLTLDYFFQSMLYSCFCKIIIRQFS